MKISLSSLLSLVLILQVSGCVTTRRELNERRNQETQESPAVRSEDLSPESAPASSSETPASPQATSPAVQPITPVSPGNYGMEEMRAELARLSGKVEEMEQEKKSLQTSQLEEQKRLAEKIELLEKQLKEKEEQEKGPPVPEGKSAFQMGKESYFAAQYEAAIEYLNLFLKGQDAGKEVEEAVYIRGECHFKLKEFKKAIVDFSKFPEKFQKSNYHPKALLKIAESFESLEMKEDAKAFYQDLFEKFPKTVEGKLAKKKLSRKTGKP